jgi:hypothetical protein
LGAKAYAAGFSGLHCAAHGALCHTQRTGNVFDRHAAPMQAYRLLAPFVLCLPRQLASVFFVHPLQMRMRLQKSTLNCRMNRLKTN